MTTKELMAQQDSTTKRAGVDAPAPSAAPAVVAAKPSLNRRETEFKMLQKNATDSKKAQEEVNGGYYWY